MHSAQPASKVSSQTPQNHLTFSNTLGEFRFGLETSIPDPWVVGAGAVLRLRGWCYHPRQDIQQLSVLVDGVEYPAAEHAAPRRDVFEAAVARGEAGPHSLTSGFYVDIPFAGLSAPRSVDLAVSITTAGAEQQVFPLGALSCLPAAEIERAPAPARVPGQPLIAICMITYNPRRDWLIRQVDTIRSQTHTSWICIINDDCSDPAIYRQIEEVIAGDDRFCLFRNPANLGFYRNSERCLSRVPPEAEFVALSDQDDIWFDDKLASLLAAFQPGTQLAYSDMQIVTEQEQPLYPTYWTKRKNNFKDLETLLFANTVTGAASLLRAGLLADILPFPLPINGSYHDHWIAAAALATGRIAYVDRPLYAYRQHTNNIIGHNTPRRHRFAFVVWRIFRWSCEALVKHIGLTSNLWVETATYFNNLLITTYLAKMLKARVANPPPEVERVAALENSAVGLFKEAIHLQPLAPASLGYPWICLRGLLLHRLLRRVMFRDRYWISRRAKPPQAG